MISVKKAVSLLLLTCLLIALFTGCYEQQGSGTTAAEDVTFQIAVTTENDAPLTGVKVFVYEDSDCNELVFVGKTDEQGKVSFRDVYSDNYAAVLENVPTGCLTDEFYLLTGGNTQIKLKRGTLTDDTMNSIVFRAGDRMLDFTLMDCCGNEYQLSRLLIEKKAVVLNFWFMNCNPCKMEFPYLQEAYEQFGDRIELLAINPLDGSDNDIAAFANERELSFPMISGDSRWEKVMEITGYPTTVVIDRNGVICLVHRGMFTDTQQLVRALTYFTADHYETRVFGSIEEIPVQLDEN